MFDSNQNMVTHALWMVALFNVCLVLWRTSEGLHWTFGEKQKEYGWIGGDYPLFYPMDALGPASMTLHETVHFSLNASDPLAAAEWDTTRRHPKGSGFSRFGPEQRVMIPTFFHQLHCLHVISTTFVAQGHLYATEDHFRHCLNYLRQTLLCGALDTLEEGDFMSRNYETDRIGDTFVCEDWGALYETMDRNTEEWLEWKAKWA
ncbi:hypothetical protein BC834DRAFT_668218 [Gloeopeniophorella convolvens]|nr:hypothetical protein BC834DRAFT_668218 [Gloeopeniophorella convolvens]